MRSQDDIRQLAKFAVGRERLVLENVETGGGHLARFQRGQQRRLLDDAATGAVEDPHAFLAFLEGGLVDHVFRVVGQRHVHRDIVRLLEQFVQRHAFHLHRLGAAGSEVGIEREDPHAKGLRPFGHLAADPAQAHDAKGLLK